MGSRQLKLENFVSECRTKEANIKESCNQKMLVFDEDEKNLDAEYDLSCADLGNEILGFKLRIARWHTICSDMFHIADGFSKNYVIHAFCHLKDAIHVIDSS